MLSGGGGDGRLESDPENVLIVYSSDESLAFLGWDRRDISEEHSNFVNPLFPPVDGQGGLFLIHPVMPNKLHPKCGSNIGRPSESAFLHSWAASVCSGGGKTRPHRHPVIDTGATAVAYSTSVMEAAKTMEVNDLIGSWNHSATFSPNEELFLERSLKHLFSHHS